MSLEKPMRIVNRALLDHVKTQVCVACGKWPTDPDHITTRGAGGGDTADNVWPLCREHHTERGNKGLGFMGATYIGCLMWLRKNKRTDILEKVERYQNEKKHNDPLS